MPPAVQVTVWNEFVHERRDPQVRDIYPEGIHAVIGRAIRSHLGPSAEVRYATLDQPSNGLTAEVLDSTEVLTWWGHCAHDEVADEVVARVAARVLDGMGLVVLHSAHYSKIFRRLMGTTCGLRWRNENDREVVWSVKPGHPICEGVPEPIVIARSEMYGEYFDIPEPDELIFVSSYSGGEVFRSGCCFVRGRGRIFYFSPGDQEYPVYHNEAVGRVIANAVRWCAPVAPVSSHPAGGRASVGWFDPEPGRG